MRSRESPFPCIGVTLGTLENITFEYHLDIGISHLNDKLIRFAKGILIVLLSTFNTFGGIPLGPVAFFI